MPVSTRIAPDVKEALVLGAREHGMGVSDYVAMILAEAHNLPQFAPAAHPRSNQGELPIVLEEGHRLKNTA